jgi:hypothetical protein
MGFKFLKFSVVSFFLVSGSLMAQITVYETVQHIKNSGWFEAHDVVDHWSKDITVEGYNVHVDVTTYANGSSNVDFPDKIMDGMDYLAIDDCTYSTSSRKLKCHYETYNYVETIEDKEVSYFDGFPFYRGVYRDIYEKDARGFFNIKRP